MDEPAKPFACGIADCGMSFTNEDHLHVHTKKHDMYLQLGPEQKAAFVADQTPTPTRFIRNCEEVGLFQDLQNVTAANPFDETFKRAMETKVGIMSLEAIAASSDDVLHTPQMMFPILDSGEPPLFNVARNITISRSSSDESGTVKGFETRTISKLTNEVTTISRIVNSDDVTIKHTDIQKDVETVSYKNNVIHIESNIASNIVRKDIDHSKPVMVYTDSVVKERIKDSIVDNTTIINKDNIDNTKLVPEKLPIMSQRSIDLVVDSLNSDLETSLTKNVGNNNLNTKNVAVFDIISHKVDNNQMAQITKLLKKDLIPPKNNTAPRICPKDYKVIENKVKSDKIQDYEVVIRLPDGKEVRMKPVVEEPNLKEVLKNRIVKKINKPNISNILVNNVKPVPKIVKLPTGTLIPVTLVNREGAPLSTNDLNKVPITKIHNVTDVVNMKLPVTAVNNANTKTEAAKSKIVRIVKRKTIPINSPEHLIVSEPYRIHNENDKKSNKKEIAESNEVVCLTEQDVANQIRENSKKAENDFIDDDDDCVVVDEITNDPGCAKRQRIELERRCAASRRYRERLKSAMQEQCEENRRLREANQRLIAEKAVLKLVITEHMKRCPEASDIAQRLTVLTNGGTL